VAAEAWKSSGAANNWAGMSLDPARGIVYVPQVPQRSISTAVIGLVRTFRRFPSRPRRANGKAHLAFSGSSSRYLGPRFSLAPALLTIHRDGKEINAIAQTSKQGFVYLFDRTTGAPLFQLRMAISREHSPGKSPQRNSLFAKPSTVRPQMLTDKLLTNRTPEVHRWALEKFGKFRSKGQFVPLSLGKDTVVFPGFDGGADGRSGRRSRVWHHLYQFERNGVDGALAKIRVGILPNPFI